ncbi:hypothetical protein Neosp_008353 [[Neocosmospora] mangrovei]
MVYCGKASQGCQNCRTRRIKRINFCVYRFFCSDPVVFHIDYYHACAILRSLISDIFQRFIDRILVNFSFVTPQPVAIVPPPRLPTPVDPSLEEQGVQFYINRYLIGHPDEPKTPGDLSSTEWLWDPAVQDVMAAVGLASLSNLRGDQNLMTTARQRYGMALKQTGRLIQTSVTPDFEVTMRSVVMLAMFELVKGANQNIAHFIPAQMSATPLPAPLSEWITFSYALLDPPDRPAADLGILICRFIELSTHIQIHVLSDGRSHTTSTLKQLLDIDAAFAEWDRKLGPTWRFRTEKTDGLPPDRSL